MSTDRKLGRIDKKFNELRAKSEKGLITYITAGDPDLNVSCELVKAMAKAGADLIELGIPFSDPLADGPAIQQASQRALAGGVTVSEILAKVKEIRLECSVPLLLMTYYNPVLQYGLKQFVNDSLEGGVDGLIVPDLPYEESGPLLSLTHYNGLDLIFLVAPNTPPNRLATIGKVASGFIYSVSVTGVTGVREKIDTDMASFASRVRKYSSLPVAIGFGISGPIQAQRMARFCDAVVVGSAIVNIIARTNSSSPVPEITHFVKDLKDALRI